MVRAMRVTAFVGVALLACAGPARAGFISVLLTAGADGSSTPSGSGGFRFTNPTGSPQVGVSQLSGPAGTVKVSTGGGFSFFSGGALPVVVNLSDGSAYFSSATAPTSAVPSGGLASAPPDALTTTVPTDASRFNVSLSDPAGGNQVLAVSVTDGAGMPLGAGQVTVPGGGWWILGLAPDAGTTPPVVDPPVIVPPVVPPVVAPPVTPPPTPPTAATPEPTTLALAALGLPLVYATRRFRRKK